MIRAQALEYIRNAFLGTWYIFGGDDPGGIDCSGMVIEYLKRPLILKEREDYTAAQLFEMFPSVQQPYMGVLIFYASKVGNINHVAIALNDTYMIEAAGGDRRTRTVEDAKRDNAYVRERKIYGSRIPIGFVDPFFGKL